MYFGVPVGLFTAWWQYSSWRDANADTGAAIPIPEEGASGGTGKSTAPAPSPSTPSSGQANPALDKSPGSAVAPLPASVGLLKPQPLAEAVTSGGLVGPVLAVRVGLSGYSDAAWQVRQVLTYALDSLAGVVESEGEAAALPWGVALTPPAWDLAGAGDRLDTRIPALWRLEGDPPVWATPSAYHVSATDGYIAQPATDVPCPEGAPAILLVVPNSDEGRAWLAGAKALFGWFGPGGWEEAAVEMPTPGLHPVGGAFLTETPAVPGAETAGSQISLSGGGDLHGLQGDRAWWYLPSLGQMRVVCGQDEAPAVG